MAAGSADSHKSKRTTYLDYIKVLASFAVMIIHIQADGWYASDVFSWEWKVCNFYDSMSRWGVPAFVMVSGVLFLNRQIPVKKIYTRYILRLATAYIVWCGFYAISTDGSFTAKFYAFLNGPFHLWFIPMMAGLYICIPILSSIVTDDKRTVYFLVLAFIFTFLIPTGSMIISHFGGGILNRIASAVFDSIGKLNIQIVLGYTGYFILGYYLNKTELTKKQRVIIYLLGLIGFTATGALTLAACHKTNRHLENYYTNMTVNVLFSVSAVFVWFKYQNYKHENLNSMTAKLSKYSFGAYILHPYLLGLMKTYGITSIFPDPVISIAGTGILLFIFSYIVSAILNHIPVLNKYIV